MAFFDANYNITKLKKSNGKITQLELNGQEVCLTGDLDANKTKTINVLTYTEPVEITPSSGKDGMKKVTVTLSNIPSSDVTSVDCDNLWGDNDGDYLLTDFDSVPDDFIGHWIGSGTYSSAYEQIVNVHVGQITSKTASFYTKVDDTSFEYDEKTYTLLSN